MFLIILSEYWIKVRLTDRGWKWFRELLSLLNPILKCRYFIFSFCLLQCHAHCHTSIRDMLQQTLGPLSPAEGQEWECYPRSADFRLLYCSSFHIYHSSALPLEWLKFQNIEVFSTNSVQTFSSSVQTQRKILWFPYYLGVYRLMRLKCFPGQRPKDIMSYLCVSSLLMSLF